jgi:hypothetical protein
LKNLWIKRRKIASLVRLNSAVEHRTDRAHPAKFPHRMLARAPRRACYDRTALTRRLRPDSQCQLLRRTTAAFQPCRQVSNRTRDNADRSMMWTSTPATPTHNQISGPITHARVRQVTNQVFSFLASYSSYLDNENVYSVLLLRNDGQEQNECAFASVTFEFQNSSSL